MCIFIVVVVCYSLIALNSRSIDNHKLNELKPNHTNQIRIFNEIEMSAKRKYNVKIECIVFVYDMRVFRLN